MTVYGSSRQRSKEARENIAHGTSRAMKHWYKTSVPICRAVGCSTYLTQIKRRRIGLCARCERQGKFPVER